MQNLSGLDVYDLVVRLPKTLSQESTVAQAAAALDDHHVHMLLITDEDGRLLGAIERSDLSGIDLTSAAPALGLAALRERTIAPEMPAEEALRLLLRRGERRRAVVDEDGRLLGLLCLKRRQNGFCSDRAVHERASSGR